jgi:hypothetical protein
MSEYCTCATSFDGSCQLHDRIDALTAENAALRSRLAKLQGGEACCVTHGEGACQLTCAKCNDELRSQLAEAEYQWKYWMGVADDNGIKSIKARLAAADALLREIAGHRPAVAFFAPQLAGVIAALNRIDAFLAADSAPACQHE